MHVGKQGTHFKSLQCVTIDHNNNMMACGRAVHNQSGTSGPNECDTGHWVYANIEASRTVVLRALGVHRPIRWKHYYYCYYYYYHYHYSASDLQFFFGASFVRHPRRSKVGYVLTHAHSSAAQAHNKYYRFLIYSSVRVICECVLQVVHTAHGVTTEHHEMSRANDGPLIK